MSRTDTQDMESIVPMQSGLTINNNDHETVMTVIGMCGGVEFSKFNTIWN